MHHTTREIVAAWVCCVVVGVAALTMVAGRDPATPPTAGLRVPGIGPVPTRELSIADQYAEEEPANDAPAPSVEPVRIAHQRALILLSCLERLFHRVL